MYICIYQEQEDFSGDTLEEIDSLNSWEEEMLADALAYGLGELLNKLLLVQALCLEPQAHVCQYLLF